MSSVPEPSLAGCQTSPPAGSAFRFPEIADQQLLCGLSLFLVQGQDAYDQTVGPLESLYVHEIGCEVGDRLLNWVHLHLGQLLDHKDLQINKKFNKPEYSIYHSLEDCITLYMKNQLPNCRQMIH